MTQPWALWFQQFVANLPPSGSGFVINETQSLLGNLGVAIGLDSEKGSPGVNTLYLAYDTGISYLNVNGVWITMIPEFTGDVVNSLAHPSVLTIAPVNLAPGVYGGPGNTVQFTVVGTGQVTDVVNIPIDALPGGTVGSVQFNAGSSSFGGDELLTYDFDSGQLTSLDQLVNGQIYFTDPVPTRTNLLPVQTDLSGYALVTDGTDVSFKALGPLEYTFNYGDATPRLLFTVPANRVVTLVQVFITTAFDGTSASISVGDTSDYGSLLSTTDSYVGAESNWSANPGVFFSTDTQVYLSITAGSGATQGAGLLLITFQE